MQELGVCPSVISKKEGCCEHPEMSRRATKAGDGRGRQGEAGGDRGRQGEAGGSRGQK